MELTAKDLMMMYQTTLRNVGLYTSISLALLGYSRFYRGKGMMIYNISFILISMICLFIAINILTHMRHDHAIMFEKLDDADKEMLGKWYQIPMFAQVMLYSVMTFSLYTLYRQIRDKK